MEKPKKEMIQIEGDISVSCKLFDIRGAKGDSVFVDLRQMRYINSVGVMNWVSWMVKMADCNIHFYNCPFSIVNQTAIVKGFMSKNAYIESFKAFFVCPKCSEESEVTLERGTHYEYAEEGKEKQLNIPKPVLCPKCQHEMEPDFSSEKHMAFLNYSSVD